MSQEVSKGAPMQRWLILGLLFSLPIGAKSTFITGHYSLSKAHGQAPQRCIEGELQYVGNDDSQALNFAQRIHFVATSPKKIEEQVPDGCHYTFEVTNQDQKLAQSTKIKNCELDGTIIEEILWQDSAGLHYRVSEKRGQEKAKTTTCDYVLSQAQSE